MSRKSSVESSRDVYMPQNLARFFQFPSRYLLDKGSGSDAEAVQVVRAFSVVDVVSYVLIKRMTTHCNTSDTIATIMSHHGLQDIIIVP